MATEKHIDVTGRLAELVESLPGKTDEELVTLGIDALADVSPDVEAPLGAVQVQLALLVGQLGQNELLRRQLDAS
jgi:hypothetical protein